jgi:hypothetical protein
MLIGLFFHFFVGFLYWPLLFSLYLLSDVHVTVHRKIRQILLSVYCLTQHVNYC